MIGGGDCEPSDGELPALAAVDDRYAIVAMPPSANSDEPQIAACTWILIQ